MAGLEQVPVIIREMDQDTAVRAMVDSNLQRPNILPSEKAFAYRMKMEAMNHQGATGGVSAKDVGKGGNDSARQVYRFYRLTYLMNTLLKAVDGHEFWTIIDRIVSARHAVEAYISREMYIRGFLDYERLVCEIERDV